MNTFEKIQKEAQKYFLKARGSHDWEHTLRVYNLALRIGKKEKANLKILKLAAILHDIGRDWEDKSEGKICHAEKGAELARKILEKYKLNNKEIEKISHCIESHRFRGKKKPQSKEAKVLFDADKLDSIGAVGLGRAFLFAGEVGAKLHNKGINLGKTRQYTKEDTAYREFMLKLRKIKNRMLTKTGKKMAKERHKFMTDFFKRLDKEVNGII